MNKILFIALVTLIVLSSCEKKPVFSLTGTLDGASGKVIVLQSYEKDGISVMDTLNIVDGEVNYSKPLEEPVLLIINEDGQRESTSFFAENAAYTIHGNVDSLSSAKITGGELNITYSEIAEVADEQRTKGIELRKEYVKANQAGDREKAQKIYDQYLAGMSVLDSLKSEIISNQPASPLSAFYTLELYSQKNIDEMQKGLALLDSSLAGSIYYSILSQRIAKLASIEEGQFAPDFTMNDVQGNSVALSSFKGKYLLIDFWASWCGPCRDENPDVVKLYNEYKDKGFDILGVSLDKKKGDWLKAIEDDQLSWNHVSDLKGWENEVAQLYAVNSIPRTFLLDKEGKIIASGLRGEALAEKLAELLN